MTSFLLPALATATAAVLARSGLVHLTRPSAFRSTLEAQGLLPPPIQAVLARTFGGLELGIALLAATALAAGDLDGAGLVVAALGGAFVTHLLVLARTRPTAPCGCGGTTGDGPPGVLALVRALLVVAGGASICAGAGAHLADLAGAERATVILAGVALAAVVDVAVAADHEPELARSGS